jgi:hypothetical protein
MKNPHLMLGDCLERMNEIPNDSIDLILADFQIATDRIGKTFPDVIFAPELENYKPDFFGF